MDFELLEAEDYYEALLKEIPKAKKRIIIAAMVLLWGKRTAPLFIMLEDAVKRGVKVTLLLDNYTRLTYLLGLRQPSSGPERLKQTFRTLENLSAQGATVYSFGKLSLPPQKGRCHVKITVIDDQSYSFGGVNFFDEGFGHTDYMLHAKNSQVADCLEQLVERIIRNKPPLPNGEVELNKSSLVLFDGGSPKSSIIYDKACELSAQAKKVHYCSAMTPSSQLARLLSEVGAVVYTNRPEQMTALEGIAQAFDQQKYRTANSYRGNNYIHAKFMLFELATGRKALLGGSHNFSYRGVGFGTQEIGLYSTNPKLYDQFYNFLQRRIIKV